ncbi:DUF2306 domain-containing protein [Arundinibacter roseus]|uniref:DUF2306 domain-containing protein n=1 Tax=Arundinibacter roseus TaxID=2070510 RepID=A0A4R4KIU0_9BACT|nr:DUF2306 domain-containing protein [Arundinibacter roseus]TDB68098.1 DUF2306 domain-containing protein [Arundinibacter roseus]
MTYSQLMYFHLLTVVPCFFLGTALIFMRKGTNLHKFLGRIYMILMVITALSTLFMPAKVGPLFFGHFGYLHLFSFLTLYSVPTAYWALKKGNVKLHKRKMILLYVGALLIAGGFTFFPGRFMHTVFFG